MHRSCRSHVRRPHRIRVGIVVVAAGVLASVGRVHAEPLAYVANLGSDDVSVVSLRDDSLVATVAVGEDPDGVAASPLGDLVFVANFLSNDVHVIETAGNSVVATIPVGTGPVGVAVSPDGRFALTADRGTNSVSVIDIDSLSVAATIEVGSGANGIAVSPDGSFAYVTDSFTRNPGLVTRIDLQTMRAELEIPVGHSPGRVAFAPDGTRAYVTNFRSHSVSVIETATNSVIDILPVLGRPSGITVGPDGDAVYITALGGRLLQTNSHGITVAGAPTQTEPYMLAMSPLGSFGVLTNFGSNSITGFDLADLTTVAEVAVGAMPFAVAVLCTDDDCSAPSRTPRATRTATATHTRWPSSTPTVTRVATHTPAPTRTPLPTSTPRPPVFLNLVVDDDGSGDTVTVRVVLDGTGVGGIQNDLLFDNRVLALRTSRCRIHPALAHTLPACDAEPAELVAPCKTLSKHLTECSGETLVSGCPSDAGSETSRFRGVVAATAVPNVLPIDAGEIYACEFEIIDAARLPTEIAIDSLVASTGGGDRIELIGTGATVPARLATSSVQASGIEREVSAGGGCAVASDGERDAPSAMLLALVVLGVGAIRRRVNR